MSNKPYSWFSRLFVLFSINATATAALTQFGNVPNSATIDFSPLINIPKTEKPISIELIVTDDRGYCLRCVNLIYDPETSTPEAVADLAHLVLLDQDWVVVRKGRDTLTVHTRNVRERNFISYRSLLAVRFNGAVGGAERKPRITTTGTVFDTSP